MSRTIEEIKEYLLAKYDPDDLVEILDLNSEEIVDRFEDKVIYYSSTIESELEEEQEDMGYESE